MDQQWLGLQQKTIMMLLSLLLQINIEELINEIKKNKGSTSIEFREKMSLEAFSETAYYDAVNFKLF